MRGTPRPVLVALAALAFGVGLAPWWTLAWTDALGAGQASVAGEAGTGGLSQVLPVAVTGGLLLTLTLGPAGRRAVAAVLAAVWAGAVAVGLAAWAPDADALASTQPGAALATAVTAAPTPWPAAYAGTAGLGVAASAWLFARPVAPRGHRGVDAPLEDTLSSWKAMDAGHDPTADRPAQEDA